MRILCPRQNFKEFSHANHWAVGILGSSAGSTKAFCPRTIQLSSLQSLPVR